MGGAIHVTESRVYHRHGQRLASYVVRKLTSLRTQASSKWNSDNKCHRRYLIDNIIKAKLNFKGPTSTV